MGNQHDLEGNWGKEEPSGETKRMLTKDPEKRKERHRKKKLAITTTKKTKGRSERKHRLSCRLLECET